MSKNRMEAFSDGVIAIIITVIVLELRTPRGVDLAALRPLLPVFLSYVLSFVFPRISQMMWSFLCSALRVQPVESGQFSDSIHE
jgi:uncharacterized membrane protein